MRVIVAALFLFSFAFPVARGADQNQQLHAEGEAALRAGDYEVAIARYSDIIKANPRDEFAYNSRGIAYRLTKDYRKAVTDFTEAIRLKREWMFSYNRAVAYYDGGEPERAIADLTQALKEAPPKHVLRADCLILRARCYFDQEKTDPALADLNRAVKLGSKDPEAYILRGILHKIRHNYGESLTNYEKAIALEPANARSYDVAAYLLSVCPVPKYRNGHKAIELASKACELTKWENADHLQTLATAYAEAGEFDRAVEFERKAQELDPREVDGERLRLFEQRQPLRDLNHSGNAAASAPAGGISVTIGGDRVVRFEVDGAQLVNAADHPPGDDHRNSVTLKYRREKDGRVLYLQHSFRETIRVKCMARLQGWDAYFETDLLPVQPNVINREIWSEPIEELVLFDFHLADDEPEAPRVSKL
jgi:tetratricopeptide (TPR) repeat protein